MSKTPWLALAGGAATAVLWLFLPLAAPLPLFLVGFGLGLGPALIGAATALVILALMGGSLGVLYAAAVLVLPVLLVVRQALLARPDEHGDLEWYPIGHLAVCLAGIGAVLVLLAVGLASSQSPDGAEAWIRETLSLALQQFGLFPEESQIALAVDILAPFAPGVAISTWMVVLVVNGTMAQGMLIRGGKGLRPATDLAMFRLPGWMPVAVGAAILLALVLPGDPGFAARNLVAVGLVPYFLVGVAVVHVISRPWPGRAVVLFLFYVLLFIFGWPVSLLLMGLGLLEQWANWRGRQPRQPGT